MYGCRMKIIPVLLCALLLLAGCTSIFTRTEELDNDSGTVPQETVPRRGGDLFIALPEDVTALDPLDAESADLMNFYSLIYETPFRYDETGRLQNVLVEEWTVSEDSRTYKFRIRDDVYFSDGTKLVATDVLESARNAMAVPEESASGTQTPAPSDSVQAEAPTQPPTDEQRFLKYGRHITGMELGDDNTLIVQTDGQSNDVLRFMTFPVTKASGSSDAGPLGTGPYAVSGQFVSEESVQLEANSSWWGETPHIERIVAVPVADPRDKIEMQQTSLIDFVTTDALNAGNYAVKGQAKVIDYMTNYFDCLVPNLEVPGLALPEVRRAISEAIDRREILSTILLNHGVPSNLPIAPDSFVMDARFRSNQRSISAALELLQRVGYRTEEFGSGRTLSVSLIVPDAIDSTYKKEAARSIAKQLADVFIEVKVETLNEEEYIRRLITGEYELAYCSYYLSPVPDLAFMLQQNGTGNYNGFDDTQIDLALEMCQAAITEEEYIAAYANLQELLNVHMPVIGLYFRMNSIICDEGIGGISNVREETIYANIASWYTLFSTRPAATDSATSSPSQTAPRRQTEPSVDA